MAEKDRPQPMEGEIDLEALAAAQAQHEQGMENTQERQAERQRTEEAREAEREENYSEILAEHDRLRQEAIELNEEIFPESAARELTDSRALLEQEISANQNKLQTVREQLDKVAGLTRGKRDIAPQVVEALSRLQDQVTQTDKAVRDSVVKRDSLQEQYGDIAAAIQQNSAVEEQLNSINDQVDQLMVDNPELMDLLHEQAESEDKVRGYTEEVALRFLTEQRYTEGKRGEEGQAFVGELVQDLLSREFERLGINDLKKTERAKKMNEVSRIILQGIQRSTEASPYKSGGWMPIPDHQGGWHESKVDKGRSDEGKELLFKGHVLASLLNSGKMSGFTLGTHFRDWGGGNNMEARANSALEEFVPTINKIKAATRVDSFRPGITGGDIPTKKYEGEQPTNIYLVNREYYPETFADRTSDWAQLSLKDGSSLIGRLEKIGYTTEGDGPIHKKDLEKSVGGQKELAQVKAEYNKELKRRQVEVNEVRQEREENRLKRIAELKPEVEKLKKELEEKQKAAERREEAIKKLPEWRQRENDQGSKLEKAKQQIFMAQAEQNSAGLFGKGKAKEATASAVANRDSLQAQLEKTRKQIGEMEAVIDITSPSKIDLTGSQLKDKEYELRRLEEVSYSPVEIVKK